MRTWFAVFVMAALASAFIGFASPVEGAAALGLALAAGFLALAASALLTGRPKRRLPGHDASGA